MIRTDSPADHPPYDEMLLRVEVGLDDDEIARLRAVCPLRGEDDSLCIPYDELDGYLLRAGITPREES